ncbi:hypothetical protein [Streptomyces californicus]|uniref:hypothetical protein n=1 Tax=Streptomyces californicus TaxID=67351 RepID=UPI00296EADEB|nr:hypothetical protein [Streptomyces californicus]MDW4912588.1 hypothetical protein [Streptomyces californicus]
MPQAPSREDVSLMLAFAARRLEEDWNTAEAAGHGVHLTHEERVSHLSVPWTRLQAEGNVRLVYDVRYLQRYAPSVTIADLDRKCRMLEEGNPRTVQLLVQEWADHPNFLPQWRLEPGSSLPLLDRIAALRAGS